MRPRALAGNRGLLFALPIAAILNGVLLWWFA